MRISVLCCRQYPWHCPQCEFDCCQRCQQEFQIPNHQHPLVIMDSRLAYPMYHGGWQCDICKVDFNPNTQAVDNSDKPYHCDRCKFDVCHNCVIRALDGGKKNILQII